MDSFATSPISMIGSLISFVLTLELIIKPVTCFTYPYPRTEYFTDPSTYGYAPREEAHTNCNDVRKQFAEGYIQLNEFMERIRSCGEQVPSRLLKTRQMYDDSMNDAVAQAEQTTGQRRLTGNPLMQSPTLGKRVFQPTMSNKQYFAPYSNNVEMTLQSTGLENNGARQVGLNDRIVKKSQIARNNKVRNFMLTSQQDRMSPAYRRNYGTTIPLNGILTDRDPSNLVNSVSNLMLHSTNNPITPSALTRPAMGRAALSAFRNEQSPLSIASRSRVLQPGILAAHQGLGLDQDDNMYNGNYNNYDVVSKNDIPRLKTMNKISTDMTEQQATNVANTKTLTDSYPDNTDDSALSTKSMTGKPSLTDADLLGLTYNDMIELGMKDDASFMEAGPKDDAKTVALSDLDTTVPANIVRAAIARVNNANALHKARLAPETNGQRLATLNQALRKKTMPMNGFLIGGSQQPIRGEFDNSDAKRSMINRANINSKVFSGYSNKKNVPIFSTKDDATAGQEMQNAFPVNGASDEITAENLATIFNEIDDDPVETARRGEELKKDVIPGSDVATATEEEDGISLGGQSPRTLETPLHGSNAYNTAAEETYKESSDGGDNTPSNMFQRNELIRPATSEERPVVNSLSSVVPEKKSDVRKDLPRKFNLASLHFGLHNGNLVE